ncbi:MAG: putative system TPR-repeat lipoprotein, partial [Acidobacteria bacterium]|nr:putative system TPR-repeat lipoprotein [Acidobacteriota bacterium]
HSVQGIRPTIAGQSIDSKRLAEQATGRKLKAAGVSSWFYARAFDWIRANPGAAAALFARKLAYTIHQTDLALNFSYDYFLRDVVSPLRVLLVGPWLLVPLGIAGALTRLRDRRFLTWFSFVPVYAVSVALFFVASRYRLPLLVALIVCAAGVIHVRRAWQVVVALLFGAIALWPFGLDSGRGYEQTNMVVWLIGHQKADEGERLMKQLEGTHRDPARLHYHAAMAYAAAGDQPHAVALLEQVRGAQKAQPVLRAAATDELARAYIRATRFSDARRLFSTIDAKSLTAARAKTLGRLALDARDGQDAAAFLSVAVDHNPNDPQALHDLGVALLAEGHLPDAVKALTRARDLVPNEPTTYLFLALARAQSGDVPGAKRDVAEALRLRPGFAEAERFRDQLGK